MRPSNHRALGACHWLIGEPGMRHSGSQATQVAHPTWAGSDDGVEQDDGDFPLGLLRVVGIGRPELEGLLP
jgi:hypothetical protein